MVRLEGLGGGAANQISGGQRQRVALARAIVCEPKVFCSTSHWAPSTRSCAKRCRSSCGSCRSSLGITFIFVTHDQEEALSLSDRIAVMARGKVLQIDTATALYERPNCREVAGFIGNMNFFEGRISSIANGVAAVEIGPGQHVRVPAGGGSAPGQAAIVAVRPEKIDAAATMPQGNGSSGANVIKARALAGSYLGDRSLVLAQWRDGTAPISVSLQNRKALAATAPGSIIGTDSVAMDAAIWLTWPVEAGVLLNS
jgi:ABC-type Fe3+/spermidine/putrescine transport system ATPase subunit